MARMVNPLSDGIPMESWFKILSQSNKGGYLKPRLVMSFGISGSTFQHELPFDLRHQMSIPPYKLPRRICRLCED